MYTRNENAPEQNRILRELKIIFPSTPHWRLREMCELYSWHLDSCIEQLKNTVDNGSHNNIDDILQQQYPKESRSKVRKVNFNNNEERIGSLIKKGYRVMILMRGPPGIGKTYLARAIVNNFVDLENCNYNIADFICSADDYFYSAKGLYKYNSAFIPEAHDFNHRRVQDKAKSGLSPIIVDNTNMQLWEMLPYVKYAVQNNYLIEIMEPKTPWSNSSSTLAQKNIHGVPQIRIQKLLQKYEKGTVASLTRLLRDTKYSKTLPQMRSLPPLNTAPLNAQTEQTADNSSTKELLEKDQSQIWNDIAITESKEQRTQFKSNGSPSHSYQDSPPSSARNVYSLLEKKTTNVWKPFESESDEFWGIKPSKAPEQQYLELKDSSTCSQKTLLDLLREDSGRTTNELQSIHQDDIDETKRTSFFERHMIDCPNEETAFVSLRQIYPNKRVSCLWDLFVKCNGDVDWAVDILLKEDEFDRIQSDDDIIYQPEDELFVCSCNMNGETMPSEHNNESEINMKNCQRAENISTIINPTNAKPQRQRSRFPRSIPYTSETLLGLKESIENCFILGDDQYSEHLLKIRNIRSGTSEVTNASNDITERESENMLENQFIRNEVDGNVKIEDDEEDNESEDFNDNMLEMSLGEELIQQLVNTFRNESSPEEQISSTLPANLKVFMPRSLAKQMYMLWVESAMNHMEEERQKVLREDEDFARLLKNPKYSEFTQSPSNLSELLDMEYAWKIYNQDKDEQQRRDIEMEKLYMPNDLASHLTQLKLCELFPDIPRETLLDMLATNGNDYNRTVSVLRSTMKIDDVCTTQEQLMECARREEDLVNQQFQNQIHLRQKRVSNNWDDNDQISNLSPEEAKRLALREFEESRNLAAHHCQLKAECYQKAKEAMQSGNGGASIYYSQIANLHIKKIDMYNHRAANCIMDVHKNTQNNPDLLDLHYLFLIEALGCLDLFLDRHITGLRIESRNYKHVFIITGRGKHSAGGVSTIKNKVKARLKERCLRWSEVNPGLLKVKIFSGSRHSKNI